MTPEQLDSHFKGYTGSQSSSSKGSIFSQMTLKQDEFEKLPSITKKKVLINMTGVRQTIVSDPNPLLNEQRFTSIKTLVTFTRENWLFLNDQSRGVVSE